MKRTFILLLCTAMLVISLPGCGNNNAHGLSSVAEAATSTPEPTSLPEVETSTSEPVPLAQNPTIFSDVPTTYWAFDSIESAYEKGLINGIGNGKFDPEGILTRAQVAQIAFNAYSEKESDIKPANIKDVPTDAWYYKPVTWLVQYGLAELDEGNFQPNDPAPRWFIADVLYKLATGMKVTLPTEVDEVKFPDVIGDYAKYAEAITALQRAGIISGFPDGTFGPEKSLTRAQMAKLIDLFTDIVGLEVGTVLPEPPEPTPPKPAESTPPKTTEPSTSTPKPTDSTPEPSPSESVSGSFDWVDVVTTYDGILRPYAESLGFECEYAQMHDPVNGGTHYFFYFTKGQVRAVVSPKPDSNCYGVIVGRPDDSVAVSRVERGASLKDYASTTEVKAVLKSAVS